MVQTFWHFIGDSLWEFLVSNEYPSSIFSSMIKFSIWLEIFMKEYLKIKNKKLIKIKPKYFKKDFRNNIRRKSKDTILDIILYDSGLINNKRNYTITFDNAILLFSKFYKINPEIKKDLVALKKIRNWLFHYKAKNIDFRVIQIQLRLFKWLFDIIEKENWWPLSWELMLIYTWNSLRFKITDIQNQIKQLYKYIDNEIIFNINRRRFKCQDELNLYNKIKLNIEELEAWYLLDGYIDWSRWNKTTNKLINFNCPCCWENKMIIDKNYSLVSCIKCNFNYSNIEYLEIEWKKLEEVYW